MLYPSLEYSSAEYFSVGTFFSVQAGSITKLNSCDSRYLTSLRYPAPTMFLALIALIAEEIQGKI